MGTLEALLAMRRQARRFPHLEVTQLISLVRSIDADATSLDFDGAIELHALVDVATSTDDSREFYRTCIANVLLTFRMSWARAILRGRNALMNQLSRDERQCFRVAGLLDDLPSPACVSWWERVSAEMRFATDQQKRGIARDAEKLTIDYELLRLRALRIDMTPRWIALDDNGAGYDVLSYDEGPLGPVNRLIEVKSSVASPLRFFVSRNEWKVARERARFYHFYVWDMGCEPPRLYQRTVSEIEGHIPSDNADGKWSTAEIPLGGIH
jgi:hypothetical protein